MKLGGEEVRKTWIRCKIEQSEARQGRVKMKREAGKLVFMTHCNPPVEFVGNIFQGASKNGDYPGGHRFKLLADYVQSQLGTGIIGYRPEIFWLIRSCATCPVLNRKMGPPTIKYQ
jgi:hypothetical protein